LHVSTLKSLVKQGLGQFRATNACEFDKHFILNIQYKLYTDKWLRVCRGRDRMVVVFITSYAISAYHH
jgi:hypothetical protein